MTKVMITRGMPGSGKTAFARELRQCFENRGWPTVIIERDIIRKQIGVKPGQGYETEELVTRVRDEQIAGAIAGGFNLILSDTNLTNKELRSVIRSVLNNDINAHIEVEDFRDASWEDIINTNNYRAALLPEKHIPEHTLRKMWGKLSGKVLEPAVVDSEHRVIIDEERTKMFQKSAHIAPQPYQQNPLGKPAYIFDIDGTLAGHEGVRGHYDLWRVWEDYPHEDVIQLARELKAAGNDIIIVSGRHINAEVDTSQWLIDNDVPYDWMLMREDPHRKDDLEKLELFNNYIRDAGYRIKGVFDDRNRVVNMWRDVLGLRCYQVAPGDF